MMVQKALLETSEIMTLREVAQFLKIHIMTAYKLVQKKELPGAKVGGQWRFIRQDVTAWLTQKARRT